MSNSTINETTSANSKRNARLFRWSGETDEIIESIFYNDSDLYLIGYRSAANRTDVDALLIKCDRDANVLHRKCLGSPRDDYFTKGIGDGAYIYTVGYFSNQVLDDFNALIAKYDLEGNLLWRKGLRWGNYSSFLSSTLYEGTLYAGGYTSSKDPAQCEALLTANTTEGELLWRRALKGERSLYYHSVVGCAGYLYAVGYARSFKPYDDKAIIVKYDLNGSVVWQRALCTQGGVIFYSAATDDAFIYTVGAAFFTRDETTAGVIAKYDQEGNLIWQKLIKSGCGCTLKSIIYDQGSLYVAGYYSDDKTQRDNAFFAKYDTDGTPIWQIALKEDYNSHPHTLATDGASLYSIIHQSMEGVIQECAMFITIPIDGVIEVDIAANSDTAGLIWILPALEHTRGELTEVTTHLDPFIPDLQLVMISLTPYTVK